MRSLLLEIYTMPRMALQFSEQAGAKGFAALGLAVNVAGQA
jgi:hypothetical protein